MGIQKLKSSFRNGEFEGDSHLGMLQTCIRLLQEHRDNLEPFSVAALSTIVGRNPNTSFESNQYLSDLFLLCQVAEREHRWALMASTAWNDLQAWFQTFRDMSHQELRQMIESRAKSADIAISQQAVSTFRFYLGTKKSSRFQPSMADLALLLLLLFPTKGLFDLEWHDRLGWIRSLQAVQKARNACTHGPFDSDAILGSLITHWELSLKRALQWKTSSTKDFASFD